MKNVYLLSLSPIKTSAVILSPSLVPNGNDISIMVMLNNSSCSDTVSLCIGISNEEQLVPAGNVTL